MGNQEHPRQTETKSTSPSPTKRVPSSAPRLYAFTYSPNPVCFVQHEVGDAPQGNGARLDE
eukprot:9340473-Pyramimonas_sp.AAC.1